MKMKFGMESGKDCEHYCKTAPLEPRQPRRFVSFSKNRYFQPSPRSPASMFEKLFKIIETSIKYYSGCMVEETAKQRAKRFSNCNENHLPRVSNERYFRNLNCIGVGLWGCWAPRPPPHSLQTSPNPEFYSFVYLAV